LKNCSTDLHSLKAFFCRGILIGLLSSCAQVVNPSGGPRDTQPPRIIRFDPENSSVNQSKGSFSIYFDEYFSVRDQNNQWIISPPQSIPPAYIIKGKQLQITLKDSLKNNTTYSIQLGNSIVDITESNPAPSIQYVFSTGSEIDSLVLEGMVVNAYTGLPEKGVNVQLYRPERCVSDSFVYKISPDFFATSDESGKFRIPYLYDGQFKLSAVKDVNKNFLYDPPEELIGFSDTLIPSNNKLQLSISVFKENEKQFVKKTLFNEYGKASVAFNRSTDSLYLKPINGFSLKNLIKKLNETKDTLNVWVTDFSLDTLEFEIYSENKLIDTLRFPLKKRDSFRPRGRVKGTTDSNKMPFVTKLLSEESSKPGNPIAFEFNRPLDGFEKDSMLIFQAAKTFNAAIEKDSINLLRINFKAEFLPDSTYKFLFKKGAFKDIYNNESDSTEFSITINNESKYGNLSIYLLPADSVESSMEGTFLCEFLNDKGKTIYSFIKTIPDTIEIDMLVPGNYQLRVIEDSNQNAKWDSGNFLKKVAPERIYYSPPINIRANWDIDEEIKVKFSR
jgi:hypothetical protein